VWEPVKFSKPSSCTNAQYAAIAKDIANSGAGAPALLRAGFHAAGTWSDAGRSGGVSGGWLQFEREIAFPVNRGIGVCVVVCVCVVVVVVGGRRRPSVCVVDFTSLLTVLSINPST
jgi:hypothetical protein